MAGTLRLRSIIENIICYSNCNFLFCLVLSFFLILCRIYVFKGMCHCETAASYGGHKINHLFIYFYCVNTNVVMSYLSPCYTRISNFRRNFFRVNNMSESRLHSQEYGRVVEYFPVYGGGERAGGD